LRVSAADRTDDIRFMTRALGLARAQLGRVAPNPAVGCVIVKNGEIVAEAATGDGGRPHGEEAALGAAGEAAHGATAYVSLEPCAKRTSDTPGCGRRLIDAGVARVVIACREPNPHSAHGADLLAAAGVEVDIGVCEDGALHLNRGFFKRLATGRPWLAVSRDSASHDAAFEIMDGETPEAALDRLGASGLTRVCLDPAETQLVKRLDAAGLIDERL